MCAYCAPQREPAFGKPSRSVCSLCQNPIACARRTELQTLPVSISPVCMHVYCIPTDSRTCLLCSPAGLCANRQLRKQSEPRTRTPFPKTLHTQEPLAPQDLNMKTLNQGILKHPSPSTPNPRASRPQSHEASYSGHEIMDPYLLKEHQPRNPEPPKS